MYTLPPLTASECGLARSSSKANGQTPECPRSSIHASHLPLNSPSIPRRKRSGKATNKPGTRTPHGSVYGVDMTLAPKDRG
jgi:hypothetical protein